MLYLNNKVIIGLLSLVNKNNYLSIINLRTTIKSIIILIIFLYAESVNAQNKISGYVIGEKDNEFLSGVEVFVAGLNKGATTNTNGYFEIQNINNGFYNIKFSCLGYDNRRA